MANNERTDTELQKALEALRQWVKTLPPGADSIGRIPTFMGPLPKPVRPDLRELLGNVRPALLSSEVLNDGKRSEALSAILAFTLSWDSICEEGRSRITYRRNDLEELVAALDKLTTA